MATKQCQSCGMPLQTKRAGDCRGTEADGSRSDTYCTLCYRDGGFISPDMTLDEMRKVVDDALREQRWPRPMRWLARRQLPSLERWRTD